MNEEKFKKNLIKHKKNIENLIQYKERITRKQTPQETSDFLAADKSGKELALVIADFKCEKCSSTENLTFNHLIERFAKDFMKFNKYSTQKKYFANICIHCAKCHAEYHNFHKNWEKQVIEDNCVIKPDYIEKIKRKYEVL